MSSWASAASGGGTNGELPALISVAGAALYNAPRLNANILERFLKGTTILITSNKPESGFYKARAGNKDGWIQVTQVSFGKSTTTTASAPRKGDRPSSAEGAVLFPGWYIDVGLNIGFGKTSSSQGKSPSLLPWSFGAAVGYAFKGKVLAGLCSDFQFFNQLSTVDPSVGNRRGSRFTIVSPMVGYRFSGGPIVRFDVQPLGQLSLSNLSYSGYGISFTRPMGFRAVALWPVASTFHAGGSFQYLLYSHQNVEGIGESKLLSKISLWQAALEARWIF